MDPIADLKAEHRGIEIMLGIMGGVISKTSKGQLIDVDQRNEPLIRIVETYYTQHNEQPEPKENHHVLFSMSGNSQE
jgi:hypothetical protein